jgi:hypothetical protein
LAADVIYSFKKEYYFIMNACFHILNTGLLNTFINYATAADLRVLGSS